MNRKTVGAVLLADQVTEFLLYVRKQPCHIVTRPHPYHVLLKIWLFLFLSMIPVHYKYALNLLDQVLMLVHPKIITLVRAKKCVLRLPVVSFPLITLQPTCSAQIGRASCR